MRSRSGPEFLPYNGGFGAMNIRRHGGNCFGVYRTYDLRNNELKHLPLSYKFREVE